MRHSKKDELAAKLKKNISPKADEKEPKGTKDSKAEDMAEMTKEQQWP